MAPPSSLPLQSSYFGVLHPSQQPTPLRFRDSEKWCILVLPKRISLTRNKENKNKTWQFWSQDALKSAKIGDKTT